MLYNLFLKESYRIIYDITVNKSLKAFEIISLGFNIHKIGYVELQQSRSEENIPGLEESMKTWKCYHPLVINSFLRETWL